MRKLKWYLGVIGLMILVGIVSIILSQKTSSKLLSDQQIINNLGVKMLKENSTSKLTKKYAQIVKKGDYSFSNPYVKVNPYGTSPLSALIYFRTKNEVKVSYEVIGKTKDTSITNKVKGYQTNHQIPVVGLYADSTNLVKITITQRNGDKDSTVIKIKTGKLPKYLNQEDIKVSKNDKSKMKIGKNELTLINRTTKQVYAIDADGKIRWYSTNWNQHMFEQLSNGHIMVLNKGKNSNHYNVLTETDYLGRIYKQYSFDGTLGGHLKHEVTVIHHDIAELKNGNVLLTVSDGSKYTEDTIAKLNRKSGRIVRIIDFKRLLPVKMYKNSKQKAIDGSVGIDWLHMNALDYNSKTGNLLISTRNQDLIMQINYKSSEIEWIFSGKRKKDWPVRYRSKILSIENQTKVTGGQHGVYLLNEKGNTENILLYDNNIDIKNGNSKTSGDYSAATEYQINTKKLTVKQKWSYGKILGKTNFTRIIGYAQQLDNKNVLIDFGYKNGGKESNIIEVDQNGSQVFNVTLKSNSVDKTYAYRAYRMNFYPDNYHFDATE